MFIYFRLFAYSIIYLLFDLFIYSYLILLKEDHGPFRGKRYAQLVKILRTMVTIMGG